MTDKTTLSRLLAFYTNITVCQCAAHCSRRTFIYSIMRYACVLPMEQYIAIWKLPPTDLSDLTVRVRDKQGGRGKNDI